MRDYNLQPEPPHNPDYRDGQGFSNNTTHTHWVVPVCDEFVQLNKLFRNPNCQEIVIGERKDPSVVGINEPGQEINPHSVYTWHSVFPQPIVVESSPSSQSTWFRGISNVGTRDYNYTAYISTRYPRAFLLNGHIWLLNPTRDKFGRIVKGSRVTVQTITRKNLALWEVTLQQQSDNAEVNGLENHPGQRVFNWGGDVSTGF